MDPIMRDVNASGVIPALEANMRDYWMTYGTAPGCTMATDDVLAQFITGAPDPFLNGVFPVRPADTTATDAAITQAMARATAAGVGFFFWVGPSASPEFVSALARRGIPKVGSPPGMVMDLADLNAQPPPDSRIIRVETAEHLAVWQRTLIAGYGLPATLNDLFLPIEAYLLRESPHPERVYFLGYRGGEPVAASLLQASAGVAGVQAVAVVPEARRQGFGAAITAAALAEGNRRGYRVGVLQASAMGYPVYRRMGFRHVCDIDQYCFMPA